MINVNSIEIKNFLSHSDSYIDFNSENGMVLIIGKNSDGRFDSNGSGKSTILEAIIYALTGNTLRGVGVNDVVNRVIGKDTSVKLDISVDSDNYIICRYRKHTVNGDSLILYKNSDNVSKRLNKDTQDAINSIINIPYTILTSSILLGEGLSSRFTQLSDLDKKSLIESTLTLDYDLGMLKDISNTRLKSFKLELSSILGSIESTKSMLEKLSTTTTVNQSDIDELIRKKEEASKVVSDLETVLSDLVNKSNVLSNGRKELSRLLSDIAMVDTNIRAVQSKIESVSNAEVKVCSLCNQPLVSEESIKTVLNNYSNELNSFNVQATELNSKLSGYPTLEVIDSKLTEISNLYNDSKAKLANSQFEYTNYMKDCASLEAIKQQSEDLDSKLSEFNSKLNDDQERQKVVSDEITCYDYIYKMFSPTGIINYILQESINYINERLSIYSNLLIDKDYKLDFTKGKLSLVDDSGASYQSLSNGEKRRLDICIQFSLHDYIYNYCDVKVNILFIDEILDTLDSTGVDNIFEVLRLKMDYCSLDGIYVITHNGDLKDKFDKYLVVSKGSDGLSKIIK